MMTLQQGYHKLWLALSPQSACPDVSMSHIAKAMADILTDPGKGHEEHTERAQWILAYVSVLGSVHQLDLPSAVLDTVQYYHQDEKTPEGYPKRRSDEVIDADEAAVLVGVKTAVQSLLASGDLVEIDGVLKIATPPANDGLEKASTEEALAAAEKRITELSQMLNKHVEDTALSVENERDACERALKFLVDVYTKSEVPAGDNNYLAGLDHALDVIKSRRALEVKALDEMAHGTIIGEYIQKCVDKALTADRASRSQGTRGQGLL